MKKLPQIRSAPLGAIRAFEAAARLGSFKLAAHELSVTPAAISHQITTLEDYLACALFVRSNRLVSLTPTGNALATQVTSSFSTLQHALTVAASGNNKQGKTSLVVSAAPSLTAKWLVPRLPRFHALHPDLDLRLSSENQKHDVFNDTSVDLVLRYGKGNYEGVHAERLWETTYVFPVCSPNLLKQEEGKIKHLRDLTKHSLLRLPLPPDQSTGEIGERWHAWLQALAGYEGEVGQRTSNQIDKTVLSEVLNQAQKGPFYSHEHLAIDTAKSGHGISLALDVLVIDDLLRKDLVPAVKQRCRDPYSHWLLYREAETNSPNLLAFTNWLRSEAELTRQTIENYRK